MLALTLLSELSMLDDELERLKLDVWFVEMRVLTVPRAASTLDDEFDKF